MEVCKDSGKNVVAFTLRREKINQGHRETKKGTKKRFFKWKHEVTHLLQRLHASVF